MGEDFGPERDALSEELSHEPMGEPVADAGDVPQDPTKESMAGPADEGPPPKKKKPVALIVTLCVLLVAGIAGGLFGHHVYTRNKEYQEQMESAQRYATSDRLDRAKEAYLAALALKPGNSDALKGLAHVYLMGENFQEANDLLLGVSLDPSDPNFEVCQRLLAIAQLRPALKELDTTNFPLVTVTLSRGGALPLDNDVLKVTEDGVEREIRDVQAGEGTLTFSYLGDEAGYESQRRTVAATISVDDFSFTRQEAYDTPFFHPAQLTLVSTDMSQYPKVRAFFRVEDSATGETVTGLGPKAFQIQERLQGGEYLAREVSAASMLEGKVGLNINLAADKSSSIEYGDMEKIKTVMGQFVTNLHFDVGDRAEVLAFDTIVQQMCAYTGDANLLLNGISNMSTDGLTALYDAIYVGVNHAALQGGARCVIAFTDGMDNSSRRSYWEVISYALSQQVPVYIVGVGSSVEAQTLRSIAEGTGGRYWFIDDLNDLEEIYNDIYTEQKELYEVVYQSDSALDAYDPRDLMVKMTGGGYRAEDTLSFQAVPTINDNGGISVRSSRYEIFKENLSWEQATQRCQEMGGHLATITSQAEMDQIIQMAEAAEVKHIWLGGYTSYNAAGDVFGHWVTGEDFSFAAWAPNEPSRKDQDGTEEWYIMLWNIESLGGWTWNDQRNDPASVVRSMGKDMGFVCEFE